MYSGLPGLSRCLHADGGKRSASGWRSRQTRTHFDATRLRRTLPDSSALHAAQFAIVWLCHPSLYPGDYTLRRRMRSNGRYRLRQCLPQCRLVLRPGNQDGELLKMSMEGGSYHSLSIGHPPYLSIASSISLITRRVSASTATIR